MKIASGISSQPDTESKLQKMSKLIDAAHQFEASMLQELLKPMQGGQDSWGGEDSKDGHSLDTIRSFGTEAVAKAISDGGGFGIAKQVVTQIEAEHQRRSQNRPP